jgi:glycerophosphoryl diester phosphodiesterase
MLTWRGARAAASGPLVIAHRGASAHELENTLAAFERARRDGADGVELDVGLSADGAVVVFHDDDLARLARRPERLDALPLADLRAVRLARPDGRAGGIPTLDEALETLGPLLVNIELKAPRLLSARRLVPRVVALWRRHRLDGRALVSCFNPVALAQLRAAAPEVPAALLFHREQSFALRRAWARRLLRPAALHPEHVLVDAPRLARWRAEGYLVNTWTVDAPDELSRLAGLGIDGIIVNDPAAARRALA